MNHSSWYQSECELICSCCWCHCHCCWHPFALCTFPSQRYAFPVQKDYVLWDMCQWNGSILFLDGVYFLTSSFRKTTDLLMESAYHQGTRCMCARWCSCSNAEGLCSGAMMPLLWVWCDNIASDCSKGNPGRLRKTIFAVRVVKHWIGSCMWWCTWLHCEIRAVV